MHRDVAFSVLGRFFRMAVAKLKVIKKQRLVRRVHRSATIIQSFLKMVVVRRRHHRLLVDNRLARHEDQLAAYLNAKSLATLSTFLPRRKKQEEAEHLIRRLMLTHSMSFERAMEMVSRRTIVSDTSAPVKAYKGRDGAYGAFCNGRIVRRQEETSDSDDDSIDEVLLASRRPGRLRPLV